MPIKQKSKLTKWCGKASYFKEFPDVTRSKFVKSRQNGRKKTLKNGIARNDNCKQSSNICTISKKRVMMNNIEIELRLLLSLKIFYLVLEEVLVLYYDTEKNSLIKKTFLKVFRGDFELINNFCIMINNARIKP